MNAPAPAVAPAAKPAAPATDTGKTVDGKAVETPPAKIHKVKVDGKEVDVAEEDLHKHYGTFAAGQKALKEAAETKKQADAQVQTIMSALKGGDYDALTKAGLSEQDIEGLSIKFLSKKQQDKLEEERLKALDPNERELEELRKDKAEREKKAKEEEQTEHQKQVVKEEQRIAKSVIDTLEQLPESYRRSDFLASRVLEAWAYFEENREELEKKGFDVKRVTPKYIADKVRAEARGLARQMAEAAQDDELDEFVPDSLAGRVLQRRQTKAQKEAHPALTQGPQARNGKRHDEEEKKPAVTTAQLMRRSYFSGG